MATSSHSRLPDRGQHLLGLGSPPDSPPSLPGEPLPRRGEAPSYFERLPPAMNEQATTPAPSDEHTNMATQSSAMVPHDEDDYADAEDETVDSNGVHRHRRSHLRHDSSFDRSVTPPVPATTATQLGPPISHSSTVISSSSQTSAATAGSSSTLTGSPSLAPISADTHHSGHSLSPFSFFGHGSSSSDHVVTSKTVRIELLQPQVVVTTGETSTMEGVVYLNLHKNTKVKSLHLEFSGRSSVTWIDDNAYSPATRHTTEPHIEHTWSLISHEHKQPPTLLESGQHAFPFSLELPETLPESLTTTHGRVSYRLTATLTKPGLTFTSSTANIPVVIYRRYPVQASRVYQRSGRAVSGPEDKVKYKITVPQVRVPHGTKVPLQVSVTALSGRTQIQVLQVGLWERVVYRADGRKRVDMRLVKIQKSEGWDRPLHHESEAWTWNKVLLFDMPHMGTDLTQCNPSADNGLMKVAHILRFSILGMDSTKRFRAENEVEINVLAFEDEVRMDPDEAGEGFDGELPSYLTSFTTPRVSYDSERDMDPADDDLLRLMVQRIHLPTYAESEEDANSRGTSRSVSRNTSRAGSRATSPERSLSVGNPPQSLQSHHHHHHHHHNNHHHYPLPHSPLSAGHSPLTSAPIAPLTSTPIAPSPLSCSEPVSTASSGMVGEGHENNIVPGSPCSSVSTATTVTAANFRAETMPISSPLNHLNRLRSHTPSPPLSAAVMQASENESGIEQPKPDRTA
ncbi:hypothetical protein BGZ99_002749 [Dissophora globulifera]|uniref:Arrestin C-terminal-like domain-containing protein n=1 Tax=Dissophora globulifera TaxID=979702 RepID=A0A9P6RQ35_9FUNG|nr:hypothetical protein BGZ99_002749 [Dissophora globulifera]